MHRSRADAAPTETETLHARLGALWEAGRYAEALPVAERLVSLERAEAGEDGADVAAALNNLALIHKQLGNLAQAEDGFREALAAGEASSGHGAGVAATLNNLGMLYLERSDLERAADLLGRALAIRERVFGPDHPETAGSLNNLALARREAGELEQAERLYQRALRIWLATHGEEHPATATTLSNLAELSIQTGHPGRAVSMLERALSIRGRLLGPGHPDVAAALNNLAGAYAALGRHDRAAPLLRRALEIWRAALGEGHPRVIAARVNLAANHRSAGDTAAARALYAECLAALRAAVGGEHAAYAMVLNNLGGTLYEAGDFAGAGEHFSQALALQAAAVGEDHPDRVNTLQNLAAVHAALGRPGEALVLLVRAESAQDRLVGQVFAVASEAHRLAHLRSLRKELDTFLSILLQRGPPGGEDLAHAFALVQRRKGLSTRAAAVRRDAVLRGRHPHLRPPLEALSTLRARLAAESLAGPRAGEPADAWRSRLALLARERDEREEALAREIPEMAAAHADAAEDARSLAALLPPGSALAEFVRYDVFYPGDAATGTRPAWRPARYLAFVLRAGEPDDVALVELGPAAPIERAVTGVIDGAAAGPGGGRHLGGAARRDRFRPAAAELRSFAFDPLRPHLRAAARLFLAPDGELARVPFEILPAGRRCLVDGFHISYLGVGRDLRAFRPGPSAGAGPPLVLADPDFDLTDREGSPGNDRPSGEDASGWEDVALGHEASHGGDAPGGDRAAPGGEADHEEAGFHGQDAPPGDDPSLGADAADGDELRRAMAGSGIRFSRLPGARAEGEAVARMLGVAPVVGAGAREGVLRRMRSPRVLHLATHGFHLSAPGAAHSPEPGEERPDAGRLAGAALENPLLRSGVALAGANTWLRGGLLPADAEDGILTAEDVLGLDLLETELVVLSACETGAGEVHVGEGLFGLRRAFVLAGAGTLVMSLWQVPDLQTRELMTRFYQNLLAGLSRADALRSAQLAVRERHPDPGGWGSFILQGDPSPLAPAVARPSTSGREDGP